MEMLSKCPFCGGSITITRFTCNHCHTEVNGAFDNCSSQGFDEETLQFIRVFLYAEGSIKQVEKIMNCSYPKVKNLLKKAKASLGVTDDVTDVPDAEDVLDLLNEGKISFDEAMERLNKKGGSL